jgi:hypothetical protein
MRKRFLGSEECCRLSTDDEGREEEIPGTDPRGRQRTRHGRLESLTPRPVIRRSGVGATNGGVQQFFPAGAKRPNSRLAIAVSDPGPSAPENQSPSRRLGGRSRGIAHPGQPRTLEQPATRRRGEPSPPSSRWAWGKGSGSSFSGPWPEASHPSAISASMSALTRAQAGSAVASLLKHGPGSGGARPRGLLLPGNPPEDPL